MSLRSLRGATSLLLGAVLALGASSGCKRSDPASARPTSSPARRPEAPPAQPSNEVDARVGQMRDHINARPELRRLNAEEALFAEVRRGVLAPWRQAWARREGAGYAALVRAGGLGWASGERVLRRERDGVREFEWRLTAGTDPAADAQRYLESFEQVDDVRLEAHRFVPNGDAATMDVSYDLRGRSAGGTRRNDRGWLALTLAKREGAWRVTGMTPRGMESLESSRAPVFAVATASTGLDRVPVAHRSEAIRRGGYALAVADYNGDDQPDVLVGNEGAVQLFRNNAGRFEEVSRAAGLRGETRVKSAVFADLDNDGRRDLVMLRFVERTTQSDDLSVYRNAGDGRFVHVPDALPRTRDYDRGMPLAVADFDNNGTLDLYLGFPGARDFTNNLNRGARSEGLVSQGLWLNDGGWRFRESSSDSTLLRDRQVYPHATLVADFDGDHRVDLLVIDDSGQMSPLYRNDGRAQFTHANAAAGINGSGWSMGASAGDYDGDGDIDVVTTHIDLLDGLRMAASAEGRESDPQVAERLAMVRRDMRGSLLYRNRGDGSFEEVAQQAGLGWVGEGAAGAEWIDYNNDGNLDLYVSNGLWSGGEEEFSSLFLRAAVLNNDTAAWEPLNEVTRLNPLIRRTVEPNPMLTVLREFRGHIEGGGALGDRPTLSMAGYQRNKLFRNNGDGSFTDVGYLEGADRTEDGYVIAPADIDNDGRQDLVLRHCDPAPGLNFESVTVLRNVGTTGNSLRIAARGSLNSTDGYGATVTAWVGGRRIVREIRAVSGAVQAEPVAFIGLGPASRAERVEIRWPTGATQVQRDVGSGRVVVREVRTETRLANR
jgi:hypothetical protein